MTDSRKPIISQLLTRTAEALKAHFFDVRCFGSGNDAVKEVMGFAKPGIKVGVGGSVTLRQLGLPERLLENGAVLLDHWKPDLTDHERFDLRIQQLTSDLFLAGANAVTEEGEIVNIDGIGNRINASTFGPRKVIIVAGRNKIVPNVRAALDRIKNIAAPLNARRLNIPVPCAQKGVCRDCQSEERICRIVSIMERKPSATDISIFLVEEELGF